MSAVDAHPHRFEETGLEETVPEETGLEETGLEETGLEETVPDETVPDETVPDETVPDETGRHGRIRRIRREARRGFTLIELMVVMSIMVLAAGLMTPTIADFFRNRALDGVRGELGSVFSDARLMAVTLGRDISVVFFREGARTFDDLNKTFLGDTWAGATSALGRDDMGLWYVLGCAGRRESYRPEYDDAENPYRPPSPYVPPFEWWMENQKRWRKAMRGEGVPVKDEQYDVTGLVRVTFHREGTMSFGPGASDVSSTDYRKDPPVRADLELYQEGNASACFFDFKPTGQFKSKTATLTEIKLRPGSEDRI